MFDYVDMISDLNDLRRIHVDAASPISRNKNSYKNDIVDLSDEEFRKRYRFTKAGFTYILDILKDDIPEAQDNRGHPIPPEVQLQVGLRYYATGTFQIVCGDICNVSQPSVSRIVRKISNAIALKSKDFIVFPTGEAAIHTQHEFKNKFGFPHVVGCVDGSYVPIQSPNLPDREVFRCRKGYKSLNIQGICDSKLKFTNIVARWPGSTHDARIFDNSSICMRFEENRIPGLLLGDKGYPCRPFLMTPFRNPAVEAEVQYNRSLSKTRTSVERMFGIWKRRFPCLKVGLRCKLDTAMSMITATVILHNIAINLQEPNFGSDDNEAVSPFNNDILGNARRQLIVQQLLYRITSVQGSKFGLVQQFFS